ncbi:MAG: hypothetical protein RL148_1977 [Planctomycetota bacterium]
MTDLTTATGTEGPSYRLVIYSDSSVHTVALHGSAWTIGRGDECDICLRDPTVSRQHLRIERNGDTFRFVDIGGKNPIHLDGKPSKEGTLALGASLTVGLTRITLDRRANRIKLLPDSDSTRVIPREVLDEALRDAPSSAALAAQQNLDVAVRTLESLELPLADLGSLEDVAEPLLDFALNLTGRRRGLIGKFFDGDEFSCIASMDRQEPDHELRIPISVLRDASEARSPFLEAHNDHGNRVERLLVPLGNGTRYVLLLEEPRRDAPSGQDALRMARALGTVIGQRLREMEHRIELRDEVARLRRSSATAQGMVLASFRLAQVRAQLRDCNDATEHLLVVGEEGTEKEAVARYAHEVSPGTRGEFVSFHPTLVPPSRVADALLGDDGALRRAHRGTLFLDHPELLPTEVQQRIALAVRSQHLNSASGALVACSVRLVMGINDESARSLVATELDHLVHCTPFQIPPLRDDARDILLQSELVLAELGPDTNGAPRAINDRAKARLSAFPWPGNTRQLRQVLEHAAARAGTEPIQPRHLPAAIREATEGDVVRVATLEDVERRHIRDVLARTGGNRSKTATLLGIASSTLYEKMRKYGIV